MIMYHWTCQHGADGITATGEVRPNPHTPSFISPVPLAWFTDIGDADEQIRQALGLTNTTIDCDRMTYRFAADSEDIIRWTQFARLHRLRRVDRDLIEFAPGVRPTTWWVATRPIPILA